MQTNRAETARERRRRALRTGPRGHRLAPAGRDRTATSDEVLAQRGPGQGVDDPDRPGRGHRGASRSCARPRFVSGGSVANTAAGLAELGGTGRVHRRGGRRRGRAHLHGEPAGSRASSSSRTSSGSAAGDGLGTGRCMVLITDDADRTMGTYLGAASNLTGRACRRHSWRGRSIVLARGLPVGRAGGQGGHAPRRRHRARRQTARSPSPCRIPFCVSRHQREFLDLLVDDVDILLGNEEEITMLFGATSHHGRRRGGRGDRAARRHDAGRPGLGRADRARPRGRCRRRRSTRWSTRPAPGISSPPASSTA